MSDLGAAFGFFPQMKPRRQGLPSDSANLPIDVLRGRLAGLLGAPADIANLLRSPSPTEMFGDVSYDAPAQFPYTTEKFLKDLPLAPTSRVGQVAGQAASFVPLNPMPAVRGVQKVGQVVGEELAATMLGQRPNTMMSKVVPQPLFAVPPEGLLSVKTEPIENLLQTKPQAPVSDIGFYSATEQAALNLSRNKGTGQSFINDLMKAPDVKKEELQFTGLEDFLRDKPNVTKQEVQDYLANNRVDVQEVTYGAQIAENPVGIAKRKEVFDKYEPEIQALYKEMDNPRYKLVNKGMSGEEYNRGVVLQNRTFRGEPLTTQEQLELNDILSRLDSITVKEFDNVEEARKAYLGMSQEEKLKHSIRPVKSPSELQQEINTIQNIRDSEADAVYVVPESTPTKFGKYTLAGGDNYREILLTLPENMSAYDKYTKSLREKYGQGGFDNLPLTDIERARLDKFYAGEDVSPYKSSHFDQPNILAHMRVNDRIDADGKKMLLVEEIQSDWHQAGRERGYKSKESLEKWYNQNKLADDPDFASLNREQRSVIERNRSAGMGGDNAVPDAPFKDTWYQLALKRLTKYAADNGYDRIGLTTGRQQAERFDLSKQVDELTYKKNPDGTYKVSAQVGGSGNLIGNAIPEEKLSDYVGKEVASKIVDNSGKDVNFGGSGSVSQPKDMWKSLSGIDLKIGGEGMKKYYDEIYPKFLDKYGKKYGASVGETKIATQDNAWNMAEQIKKRGITDEQWRAFSEEEKLALWKSIKEAEGKQQETIRYLDITPQMKEGTSKGQPLFAATPAIPAAGLLDEEKRKEITSLLE